VRETASKEAPNKGEPHGQQDPDDRREQARAARRLRKDGEDRSFWTQVGSAFRCKDGSFNLVLDYVPTGGGTLNLRPARPKDEA
jgi:hypothetical protein